VAKIHFIQDTYINESLGIMCLSSYLKQNGHQVEISFTSWGLEKVFQELDRSKPDVVGFSVMTSQEFEYEKITKQIKARRPDVLIIWGGPHCTFMPKQVATIDEVDMFAVGEGEETLLEVMDHFDGDKDFSQVEGLWVRLPDRQWIEGSVRQLEDLDKYPFPDRELYYGKSKLLRNFDFKRVMTGRGCPYKCNFCFEPAWNEMYKGKGKVIRRRSPQMAVAEIKDLITRYPTKTIHFSDDSFNLNRKTWVKEFLPLYKKEIGLPFTANVALGMIDEEFVKGMKEAGCFGMTYGLETGNEEIRRKVLQKEVTNEEVFLATDLFKKYKLKCVTFVMYGTPTETLDNVIETIHMLKRTGVSTARPSIMKMYKGTKLAEYALKNNYVEAEGKLTYKAKDPNDEHRYMENMMWLTFYFMKVPGLVRYLKPVLKFKYIKLFKPLMILTYWPELRFFQANLWDSFKYFLASKRTFMEGIGEKQQDIYVPVETKGDVDEAEKPFIAVAK
jgi:radical SAM superfamily enzyme YgiQ (UPF0313 family)